MQRLLCPALWTLSPSFLRPRSGGRLHRGCQLPLLNTEVKEKPAQWKQYISQGSNVQPGQCYRERTRVLRVEPLVLTLTAPDYPFLFYVGEGRPVKPKDDRTRFYMMLFPESDKKRLRLLL